MDTKTEMKNKIIFLNKMNERNYNKYCESLKQIKRLQKSNELKDKIIEKLIISNEELADDLKYLQEKYDNLKQDLEENYRRISISEQVDIDDSYFMGS